MMLLDSSSALPLLDQVRIASPCSAKWEAMKGDDRKRFCSQCSLHVYNLSEMSSVEAERFLQSEIPAGERVCARFYRRKDGTILTKDCPIGSAAIVAKQIRIRVIRSIAAAVAFLFSGLAMVVAGARLGKWAESRGAGIQEPHYETMGAIAIGEICPLPENEAAENASEDQLPEMYSQSH